MPARHGADAKSGRLEADDVRAMFDRIAGVYDPLNTAMTAGLHHRWRARAADLAHVGPGSRVLDVATGTGDLAIELSRRVAPDGEVVGSDFSERMLDLARAKSAKRRIGTAERAGIRFEWGDALSLPYADDTFDAATVGFGARNFSDLTVGLSEMARVVKPGGRVVVLDFTTPTRPPLSWFYRVWFDRIVPLLGHVTAPLASRRRSKAKDSGSQVTIAEAYTYLPNSVKRFLTPEQLAAEMQRIGMMDVRYVVTAGGIVVIHAATVPL
ncbi:MAG TPA: ubiquinone/menaquinone biosynthesis methyltransferase [Solirubrobacteraceae bacterium]